MKASELRIGNWLQDQYTNVLELVNADTIHDISIGSERYQPIPLTEEWLLKLGFEIHQKHENGNIFRKEISYHSGFKVWLDIMNKGGKGEPILFFILSDNAGKHFMLPHHYIFLHELQNLWTSLGGEELTITTE